MNPYHDLYEEAYFTDPSSPVTQAIAIAIALVVIWRLTEAFADSRKEIGTVLATFTWLWEFSFFPLAYLSMSRLGWWGFLPLAVWLFGVAMLERRSERRREKR